MNDDPYSPIAHIYDFSYEGFAEDVEFYDNLGARPVNGWYVYRLEGEALKKLGEG